MKGYKAASRIFCLASLAVFALAASGPRSAEMGPGGAPAQAPDLVVTINDAQRFQRIDGFGVNANSASWDGGRLAPALDVLQDTAGVNIWRVIVEEADWEADNDNDDPGTYNWDYYNQLYEDGEFPGLWALIEHLNQRDAGVVMLNVMGRVPFWMGRDVIEEAAEDEWAEMIASMVYYGRTVKGLEFRLLSPTNEIDIGAPEGPRVAPAQYVRLLNKLLTRLDALGLNDIELVPPDIALVDQAPNYLAPLFADAALMARVRHLSFHDYGGRSGDVPNLIAQSPYPDRTFWMTEFSAGCPGCDAGQRPQDPWNFGFSTADLLLRHLEQGASAAIVYEGYDSYYDHHNAFGYWGLMSYNEGDRTYAPTKRLYLVAQIFRFVRPGMVRIGTSGAGDQLQLLAFTDPQTGELVMVGRNPTGVPLSLQLNLPGPPAPSSFEHYRTSLDENLVRLPDVTSQGNVLSVNVPGLSVFTLRGGAAQPPPDTQPPSVTMTAPPACSTVSGTAVAVAASASDNVGVTQVQFTLDGQPLGAPDTAAPYAISWDSTTVANGAHKLGATARDAVGNLGTAEPVCVAVANGGAPSDTEPPTVRLTAPQNGATVSGPAVTIAADAADNVGVASVQFLLDGEPLGAPDTSAPFELSWDSTSVSNGTHTLAARARDAAGNTGTSPAVMIMVLNQPAQQTLLVGHDQIEATVDQNPPGMAEAFRFEATCGGTANTLSIYLDATSEAARVVVGLFADGEGGAGALLSQATIDAPRAGAWNSVPIPAARIAEGGVYWIGVLGPVDTGTVRFRDREGGGPAQTSFETSLTRMPAVWAAGKQWASAPISAYVSGVCRGQAGNLRLFLPLMNLPTTAR